MARRKPPEKTEEKQKKQTAGSDELTQPPVEISYKTGKPKKKPRGKPGTPPSVYDLPENDTRRILADTMTLANMERPTTEEGMIERFNWYFNWCVETGRKPTIEGFCLGMGNYGKYAFHDWECGNRGEFKQQLAKKAKAIIMDFMATAVNENKINPVTWMFYGKNYFGYSDKREIELTADTTQSQYDQEHQKEIIDALPIEDAEVIE